MDLTRILRKPDLRKNTLHKETTLTLSAIANAKAVYSSAATACNEPSLPPES